MWTPGALAKIAEHGLSQEEVETVLMDPDFRTVSRTSGRPLAVGHTDTKRYIAVVYEYVDDIALLPVTACDLRD